MRTGPLFSCGTTIEDVETQPDPIADPDECVSDSRRVSEHSHFVNRQTMGR
jgi:hypothetical protein